MPLQFKFKTKAEIPEASLSLYVEKDEVKDSKATGNKIWVLDLVGAVDKDRLDEFRANNIQLNKQLEDLGTKYEGIDPEATRQLMQTVGNLKPDEVTALLKNGKDIDSIVAQRTKGMTEEHARKLGVVSTERDQMFSRLTEVEINQATIQEATKRGLRPTALTDITNRARSIFKLSNGKPTAFEPDGKTVKYGADSMTPLSIAEWLDVQVVEAPHLFEQNSGGGANGNGSGGGHDHKGPNPWKKESANLTKQMELLKKDPALASRLKSEAGIKE